MANPAYVFAQCAPGTVNTGSSDTSTDQIVEQVRQRREQQATVAMFAAGSAVTRASLNTAAASAGGTSAAASGGGQSRRTAAAPSTPRRSAAATKRGVRGYLANRQARREAVRERYVAASPAPTYSYYSEGSYKDAPEGYAPQNGAWAAGYGGYEHHTNIAPSNTAPGFNPSRTTITKGFVAGADTIVTPWGGGYDAPLFQLGVLGGAEYNHSSITSPANASLTNPPLDGSQVDKGGFLGVYGSYIVNSFAADFLVKGNFYDHRTDPSAVCAALVANPGAGVNPQPYGGKVSEDGVDVAGNLYYRVDLRNAIWVEPTVGFRYNHTSYDDIARQLFLTDGDDFRIQGGIRVGTSGFSGGYHWTASVFGGVYDDVSISGYVSPTNPLFIGSFPGIASPKVDEGKIRGLGMFNARVDDGKGTSLLLQFEVRGGEDLIGYGGKVGLRYEW